MATIRFALTALAAAGTITAAATPTIATAQSRSANKAQELVDKAANVVVQMERSPGIRPLLARAAGLYIIPVYGNGGFIIGGKGGAGVVVSRTRTGWSSPAFFDTGGLSIGLQAGFSGGSIVYILLDRKAVDVFRSSNKFALGVNAGLSVVNYSTAGDVSTYKGDAVMWTNLKGLYGSAAIGATDVGKSGGRTRAYYGRDVSTGAILDGEVRVPGARVLTRVLPGR